MGKNFKEQLKGIQKEVRRIEVEQRKDMRKYDFCDDVSLVTDLRLRQDLLLIGGGTVFPSIKKSVRTVTTVTKGKELDALADDHTLFDRIFFSRQQVLSETTLLKAVGLLAGGGLLCFFSEEEGLRAAFIEAIAAIWPQADVWISETNIGPVVMTNANGPMALAN